MLQCKDIRWKGLSVCFFDCFIAAFVVTTIFISNVREFLPNPSYEQTRPQEDNLNSALYLIRFFPEDPTPLKPRYIVTTFSYLSVLWHCSFVNCITGITFEAFACRGQRCLVAKILTYIPHQTKNISDAQCFRLKLEKIRKGFVWKFFKQDCVRVHTTISRAMCTCNDSGYFYGVTTDMYDPNVRIHCRSFAMLFFKINLITVTLIAQSFFIN